MGVGGHDEVSLDGKREGRYPIDASKEDKTVAEKVREFCVRLIQESCVDQEDGFWEVTQRRAISSS